MTATLDYIASLHNSKIKALRQAADMVPRMRAAFLIVAQVWQTRNDLSEAQLAVVKATLSEIHGMGEYIQIDAPAPLLPSIGRTLLMPGRLESESESGSESGSGSESDSEIQRAQPRDQVDASEPRGRQDLGPIPRHTLDPFHSPPAPLNLATRRMISKRPTCQPIRSQSTPAPALFTSLEPIPELRKAKAKRQTGAAQVLVKADVPAKAASIKAIRYQQKHSREEFDRVEMEEGSGEESEGEEEDQTEEEGDLEDTVEDTEALDDHFRELDTNSQATEEWHRIVEKFVEQQDVNSGDGDAEGGSKLSASQCFSVVTVRRALNAGVRYLSPEQIDLKCHTLVELIKLYHLSYNLSTLTYNTAVSNLFAKLNQFNLCPPYYLATTSLRASLDGISYLLMERSNLWPVELAVSVRRLILAQTNAIWARAHPPRAFTMESMAGLRDTTILRTVQAVRSNGIPVLWANVDIFHLLAVQDVLDSGLPPLPTDLASVFLKVRTSAYASQLVTAAGRRLYKLISATVLHRVNLAWSRTFPHKTLSTSVANRCAVAVTNFILARPVATIPLTISSLTTSSGARFNPALLLALAASVLSLPADQTLWAQCLRGVAETMILDRDRSIHYSAANLPKVNYIPLENFIRAENEVNILNTLRWQTKMAWECGLTHGGGLVSEKVSLL